MVKTAGGVALMVKNCWYSSNGKKKCWYSSNGKKLLV